MSDIGRQTGYADAWTQWAAGMVPAPDADNAIFQNDPDYRAGFAQAAEDLRLVSEADAMGITVWRLIGARWRIWLARLQRC